MAIADDRYIHMYPNYVRLGHVVSGAIAYIDLDSNTFSLDEQFTTLVTQGTVTTHEKDILDRMLVNTSNQVFQAALNEAMLGAATTSGLPTGQAAAWGYDGTYNSQNFELRVGISGTDLDAGTDVQFEVVIWRMQPKQYRPLATFTAKQVIEQTAQFTVQKALLDIDGNAIVGLRNTDTGDYLAVIKLT